MGYQKPQVPFHEVEPARDLFSAEYLVDFTIYNLFAEPTEVQDEKTFVELALGVHTWAWEHVAGVGTLHDELAEEFNETLGPICIVSFVGGNREYLRANQKQVYAAWLKYRERQSGPKYIPVSQN